ncbi:Alanine racemase [Lentibacillus sp. JNUCC-1]|uniref:alanine racemase n=1 Tax=Lentibacillus sp. JNUCC-1 TaxID=2654513 RepID=UPI0012E79C87|nr:alanine racemase [Lentibacillus sp. JNUCC-1]MUV38500.1 Alanine racemase [Lentibacillus sp. JNUCC-1]
MKALYRPTWANINLEAIGYNINQIRKRIPAKTGIMAVVKADGYGHGAVEVGRKALASGAEWLAVALLEEALSLRKAGINAPILVFGWVSPEDVHIAAQEQVTLTFFQKEWLEAVNKQELDKPLQVHMKWDTGMGRVGIRSADELDAIVEVLRQSPKVSLTGIYTHFATADEADLTLFNEQQERFQTLKSMFEFMWPDRVNYHTGNSAAASRFPDHMYDYIRFGIAMYGLYPSAVTKKEHPIDLKPALSLHSRLTHVKEVYKGATISYGATYHANSTEWVGTIPIGYADGWIRKLQGVEVLVEGKRMPVVGRICMDRTMIKLDQSYPIGTRVTLIGCQGEDEVTADDIAEKLDTINYEVACMISERVPRLYGVDF